MVIPTTKASKPVLQPMVTAIRSAMRERHIPDARGLAVAMGLRHDQYATVWNWMMGKNGPNAEMRPRLAQTLGLDEAVLTSPQPSGHHRPREPKIKQGPAARALALVEAKLPAVVNGAIAEPVRDVFTITGRSDGQISLRLSVTLDATRGLALARFLMDAGLIISGEEGAP